MPTRLICMRNSGKSRKETLVGLLSHIVLFHFWQVGTSNYSTDWFFVQPLRFLPNGTNAPTVWRIDFPLNPSKPTTLQRSLDSVNPEVYVLRVAVAAANQAALTLAVNDPGFTAPVFDSGVIGQDNALARASDHGDYCELEIKIAGSRLRPGVNSLFLKQRRAGYAFTHIMYDYIRMEGPVQSLILPGSPPQSAPVPSPKRSRAPPLPVQPLLSPPLNPYPPPGVEPLLSPPSARLAPPEPVSASTGVRTLSKRLLKIWLVIGLACAIASSLGQG
jgi:hypothetical protein